MPGTSAGHLSLRVEGLHADDVPFLFERRSGRMGLFFFLTAGFDVLIAILIIVASRYAPARPAASAPTPPDSRIVWVAEQGAGGGGGGGGNQMPEPPRQAQLPGEDRLSVPVAKPPTPDPQDVQAEPTPVEPLMIPAQALASAVSIQAGIIAPAEPSLSQGPGTSRGAGTGSDDGIGPGQGRGLGPGFDRGTGGDRFRPGSGVTLPVEIYVPKPRYTADAMRARIQGTVWVECVVERNGACTNTRVVRSLDPTFGLDDEAVKAAGLFRFRPGMRMGEPVPVLITIEMSFSLH